MTKGALKKFNIIGKKKGLRKLIVRFGKKIPVLFPYVNFLCLKYQE